MAALVLSLACAAVANEYRMLPVTGWDSGFLDQADVDKLLGVPGVATSTGDARDANFNAILVEVRRRADVCYPSALGEPYMSGLSPSNFNALQAMIRAAHDTTGGKKRVEVHCWIVTFRTGDGVVHSRHDDPADPDNYWVTLDNNGAEPSDMAFDPGHPKAEQYTVDVCMDLVKNFDIDGIHFDYIRYTGPTQGYNPTSIARYNARYGTTGQPDAGDPCFQQWRRDQVTAVVRKVYAEVQAAKPWVKVSGSFRGGTPSPTSSTRAAFMKSVAYAGDYSDWDSWVQEGIVDMAVPMTYFDLDTRLTDYQNWLHFQADRKANRLMVPDAGVYLNDLDDAISMLQMTRDATPAGNYADGFGAYSYQLPYASGSWSTFKARFVSEVAPTWEDVPDMPWKSHPTKGHIGGTVTLPPDGAWADGAIVKISGPESRTMVCDGTGFYAFIDLTPGIYTVTADYSAFETTKTLTVTAGHIADGSIYLRGTDPTPPVITDISVSSVTDGSAVVTWTTDDPATSLVEYDFVPYYGQSTVDDPARLTSHSVTLNGLTPSTSYHLRVRSVNAAGLVSYSDDITFSTQPLSSTIIVDDLDSTCTLSGWTSSSATSGWNGGYKYASPVTGNATANGTWAPPFPRSGLYDVYTYYRAGTNRNTASTFTINYSGGSISTVVDQTQHDRQWWPIATGVQFASGQSGSVTLTNKSTATGNVIADAVKFEYKGDTTPPIMTSVTDSQYTTSTTTLQATWSGSDAESGVSLYRYAVGTQPGLADVKPWTDAGTATSISIGGLTLTWGRTYYISARAINGAGLTSLPLSSSGVTVAHSAASISDATSLPNGQAVCISSAATARFGDRFYIEDANRASGLRVSSSAAVSPNQTVQVYGVLGLADGCERALTNCRIVYGSVGPTIEPVAIVTRSAGGSAIGSQGLGNVGLLVRVVGTVRSVVSDGFYLDDGGGLTDETGAIGIKVYTGAANSAAVGARLGVTGVVSCRSAGGKLYPVVLQRESNAY